MKLEVSVMPVCKRLKGGCIIYPIITEETAKVEVGEGKIGKEKSTDRWNSAQ